MIVERQEAAGALLLDPATYGETGPVEVVETHISRIFLVGRHAFKLKRAVKLPYVDFSTPALRLTACEKEVELNSKTAPGLYAGVRRITRGIDGRLAFDGAGELVDAAIEMVRFDQSKLLDRMAVAGQLTPALLTTVAGMIARYHRGASEIHTGSGSSNLADVIDINAAGFATSHVFQTDEIEQFTEAFRIALARHSALLDRREAAGKIRRCHGDLHLRNICLFDGGPRLFDCIEFNDKIAGIDVLYDLAFLLMDLWHRGFPEFANLVMNRYLDEADDEDGFILLPFFMAVRAAVRAHVTATQVEEGSSDSERLVAEARSYFELARTLLRSEPPRLIAIGGLSGSGKTTVAEALAPYVGAPPGARIVESDRIRKAMHGVPAETTLPDRAYRPGVSERVYRQMVWRSELILSQGGCVVTDAVFDREIDRDRIEKVARERGIAFAGFWLAADALVLWQRVSERKGGPSDATVDILSRQLQRREAQTTWRRVEADRKLTDITAELLDCLLSASSSSRSVSLKEAS
ncbi:MULTISPECIES: bifunctional aminoglycoside phosphotransferase/ATP-binding protein [unclassified Mesorhizobium]|uniref:bifunctional aminoglycoside phosphotransferase/ATP-binding protein n=1 Tax=unclassified Mesorhizobium TaxID=325217 RepID=UPI000FCC4637|nr:MULTISPECIES: bifunctional aminoglycoside phosphotransferase/ATP-binding protein [unclassified Mesorhizobium]RUW27751.1 aminoglycoside phosphotransferase [Mesorhizobium sp. M4B.F.Ca.ET.013.02.1.1]RUW73783.1 aminoglycoside phosphotransferase [Mesorhizobium sp. M4B.F.Ca.ET.049.02.1.2]RVD31692.1 aminoglycoside phosphotransferase [Mesorhizobium sp. M4B.F.Ca.ET.017.02.2.1]RVD39319.1 aminoglycoside phosphotransferase [Mesorhizobium sp. M4B.F.Ca.ET.019.03.1.1]RWF67762.1 MAG: aminoglycoside phospho